MKTPGIGIGIGIVPVGLVLATVLGPAAQAVAPAPVSVTIRADGTDLSGVLRSGDPETCAAGRTVVVFKVTGAVGGGNDVRFASDTTDDSTSLPGGRYAWSTGNTGTEGRFYARVRATPDCRGARSAVVRAQRES